MGTMRFRLALGIVYFLLIGSVSVCRAQDGRIKVSGTVLFEQTKDPITQARVYGYYTYDDAKEAEKSAKLNLENNKKYQFEAGLSLSAAVMADGSYEFSSLPKDGAILFIVADAEEPTQLIRINGRSRIDVFFDFQMIDAALLTVNKKAPKRRKPTLLGNTIHCGMLKFPFPQPRMGRSNGRFAIQTYVVDMTAEPGKDTIEYHYPIIMDGEEYHFTQLRRKGFAADRDPLLVIADSCRSEYGWLTDTTSCVGWEDSYYLENPEQQVKIFSRMWWEDYNTVYYRHVEQLVDSRRLSQPMRFLDYDVQTYDVDMNSPYYLRVARAVPMDDVANLAIQFEQGAAKLDVKDSTSVAEMEKLLSSIRSIVEDPTGDSKLLTYTVYGTASPEGSYEKNNQLAKQRMEYIRDRIQDIVKRNVYSPTYAKVATWEEMADTLEALHFLAEANAIREIVEHYPNNMDAQGLRIRNLPYYKSNIVPHLRKLRSVKVVYKYVVTRNLTPIEILTKYRTDPAIHSGKQDLLDYEYWALFKMIKDSMITDVKEQEEILRRGVNCARMRDKHWQLPENLLAEFLINHKGKPDTTLLAPHIDFNWYDKRSDGTELWADRDVTSFSGEHYIVNASPIVANQVVMMMKAGQFERAADLAQILRTSKDKSYMRLYYIARCMGGYFNDDKAEDADELYRAIKGTSPRNSFVINLATEKFQEAKLDLNDMDPDDPITHYLHAQFICQKYYKIGTTTWMGIPYKPDQDMALKELATCFRMSPDKYKTALSDFDIFEDLIEPALEESKKEILDDIIPLPEGLFVDELNPGWYGDKKDERYEIKNGKFVNVKTGEEYKPQ